MPGKTVEERFWEKVDRRGPDECWEWQAARGPKGYGLFAGGEYGRQANRVAYQLTYGLLTDRSLVVHHRCDNPPCCNPAHLVPTTNRHNILIGASFSAENARKTHCAYGHPLTEDNIYRPPHRPERRECRICRVRLERKRRQTRKQGANR